MYFPARINKATASSSASAERKKIKQNIKCHLPFVFHWANNNFMELYLCDDEHKYKKKTLMHLSNDHACRIFRRLILSTLTLKFSNIRQIINGKHVIHCKLDTNLFDEL